MAAVQQVEQWAKNMQEALQKAKSQEDTQKAAATSHQALLQIKALSILAPFQAGYISNAAPNTHLF